jgi:hypothetical protein
MNETSEHKELDCSKKCKTVIQECVADGVEKSVCESKYARCVSYCGYV